MLLSKDELVSLKEQKKSDREIAGIFGISEAFVSFLLKKYGIVSLPMQTDDLKKDTKELAIQTIETSKEVEEKKPGEPDPSETASQVPPQINEKKQGIRASAAAQPKPVFVEPSYPLSYSTVDSFGKKVRMQLTKDQLIRLQNELKTDKKIAERLKISPVTVMQIRRKYGIESKRNESRSKISISREELIGLQKLHGTDRKIAENLGISQLYIFHLRKKYKIQSVRKNIEPEISKEQFLELQKELGADSEIAKRLNLSTIKVSILRRKLDIPSIKKEKNSEEKYVLTKEQLIELQKELKSDRKIAESIGKSLSYVFHMRKHYNIPIYHKNDNEKLIELDGEQKVNFLFHKLIDIRHDQKLKQYEFAQKIGISDAHLRKFEHGMKYPRIYILLKLMNEFNINPNYLFVENEMQKYLDGEIQDATDMEKKETTPYSIE